MGAMSLPISKNKVMIETFAIIAFVLYAVLFLFVVLRPTAPKLEVKEDRPELIVLCC